jgi:hypothetical protein
MFNEGLLVDVGGEGGGADRFGGDAEDHGELVEGHFGAAEVVAAGEYVGGFERGPAHFAEVQAPYHGRHFEGGFF